MVGRYYIERHEKVAIHTLLLVLATAEGIIKWEAHGIAMCCACDRSSTCTPGKGSRDLSVGRARAPCMWHSRIPRTNPYPLALVAIDVAAAVPFGC
jgi:hypothetical protein